MELQISRDSINSNRCIVESMIPIRSGDKFIRVEYRSHAEYFGSVDLFIIPKARTASKFEAFVKLLSLKIHTVEEWQLNKTTLQNAKQIWQNFMAQISTISLSRI